MNRICLDTSAYSHLKQNDPKVVDFVDAAKEVGMPSIVLGELRMGFLLGGKPNQNETELRSFLSSPVVRILEINDATSEYYAELMADLRRAGTPLPTNDVWIAALALQTGALVVTYDEHFNAVRRVGALILKRS